MGLFLFLGVGSAAIVAASLIKDLPSATEINNRRVNQSTKIFDRSGEVLLYEIHGEEKRTVIPLEQIPKIVKDSTIAIEDQNFYQHPAFDWQAIGRALIKDIINRRIYQGGSTITQQLAKNAFLSPERTLTRKVKELLLAIKLERQFSKEEILSLYLNQIPYGSNAYGIEAAAQTYFGKTAKDLNIAEAALLAALPKAPTYYSPWGQHADELMARKDYIIDKMAELGFIDEQQKNSAKKTKFKFAPQAAAIKAPHFVMAVQDYLLKKYGEETLEKGGLKVITTLDWKLQQTAEKVVAEGAERNAVQYKGKNAALFAQDPKTGQILAVVGSKDYFDTKNEGNFNVAMQGLRQPGSAFKPFAYVTAFKKGYTPETVLFDVETEFDTTGIASKSYKPGNFGGVFHGPVSMREALGRSINIPSVKVMYLAGIDDVIKTAKDFGITTLTERSRYGLSLVLGGGEVKLSEMVGAYSVFAQDGIKHKQTIILKIEDAQNNVLEEYVDEAQQVIEPQYARLINDILSDVEVRRKLFGSIVEQTIFPGHDVALKTGTTNDFVDVWVIGYTPSLITGIWAGNNRREPMEKSGSSIITGVPIWSAFMKEALAGIQPEPFTKPEPHAAEKPVLRGEYAVNNEVHTILYYVDKNNPQGPPPTDPTSDPQFENWESSVQKWARENAPGYQTNSANNNAAINISVINPLRGAFIQNGFPLNFYVNSGNDLNSLEIVFNGVLLERMLLSDKSYVYQKNISVSRIETQNLLSIKVTTKNGAEKTEHIILFK